MTLAVGTKAPAFELRDQDKNLVSLEDLKGTKSLIVFIPFPFTGNCEAELCAIRDNLADLNDVDAKVVAITCHAVATNAAWASQNAFHFPVLSDYWPHGSVTTAYDNFNDDLGCAMRTTYVLDADGIIRDVIKVDTLGERREFSAYTEALATL
jgi:peroxiredoxin